MWRAIILNQLIKVGLIGMFLEQRVEGGKDLAMQMCRKGPC